MEKTRKLLTAGQVKEKVARFKNRAYTAAAFAAAGVSPFGSTSTALAGDSYSAGVSKASNMIFSILDPIMIVFPVVGIVLILVGVYKLVMAFRNNQPDAYSDAAKDAVIGLVLIIFRAFLWPVIRTAVQDNL